MRPIEIPPQTPEQIEAVDEFYRTTRDMRLHSRAQMILLAAEKGWTASIISAVVRCDENTVRLWLNRCLAEGIEGLQDEPRPGISPKVTLEYEEKLLAAVRVRPRSLDLAFSTWTLQRLVDKHSTGTIFVAWDNASTHEDNEIEAVVRAAAGQLGLLYLPSYSPWLNPIEHLWRQFRREVTHCGLFEMVKASLSAAEDFFVGCNAQPDRVLSIVRSHPWFSFGCTW